MYRPPLAHAEPAPDTQHPMQPHVLGKGKKSSDGVFSVSKQEQPVSTGQELPVPGGGQWGRRGNTCTGCSVCISRIKHPSGSWGARGPSGSSNADTARGRQEPGRPRQVQRSPTGDFPPDPESPERFFSLRLWTKSRLKPSEQISVPPRSLLPCKEVSVCLSVCMCICVRSYVCTCVRHVHPPKGA